jgi:hypothetical protein
VDAWAAVVAALAGGAIALAGGYLARRRDERVRTGQLLLEQCAQVVSLSDDFRNRIWEEVELGHGDRVDGWDLFAYQSAVARIKLLTQDSALLDKLQVLTASGKAMGGLWRRGNLDRDEVISRREADKIAAADFIYASSAVVRRYLKG